MIQLQKSDYPSALALFRNSRHQMKLPALAEGRIEADVWADGPEPSVAAVRYCNKLLVASALPARSLASMLRPFLLEHVYDRRMDCGAEEALLLWDGEGVCDALLAALEDKCPAYALREYYELDDPAACRPALPPDGYGIVPVDAALLEKGYARTDALRAEMCSERPDVASFLHGSFGVAAVSDGVLTGWCLSEYNTLEGCEVGIEVAEGHRRRGLALAMAAAFCREAAARGLRRIGWHCFKTNAPSSATALSAGFRKALEYGELFCFFEPALQYAVNGNFCDNAGRFAQAVTWYERAVAEPGAPLWAYVRLAMALASLGQVDAAFGPLFTVVGKGFCNWGWLRAEPRLEPLREDDRWKQLF
jgi:RimJ/RimL family protein N-acetyltransferase